MHCIYQEQHHWWMLISAWPPTNNYIIEHFPGDKASAPLEDITASQSNFEKYWQQLNQLNSTAEYAPFVSRIDWDVAQWAKIHGLTFSAVTKLLKLDGVHISFQ